MRNHSVAVFSLSIVALTSFALTVSLQASAESATVSCECANTTCGPCEEESGTTFYSSKCGADGSRTKSCKKPTCVPVEDQKVCLANLAAERSTRSPARQNKLANKHFAPGGEIAPPSGEVKSLKGKVKIVHADIGAVAAEVDQPIYRGDIIVTDEDGFVHLRLYDNKESAANKTAGSEVVLPPNSRLQIDEVYFQPAEDRRKVALNLLKGAVRNHVTSHYLGANKFEIRVGAAVAGVRGTDFITVFDEADGQKWKSQVFTLEGKVKLSTLEAAQAESRGEKPASSNAGVDVPAGNFASLSLTKPVSGASDAEIASISRDGKVSDVQPIQEDQAKKLEQLLDLTFSKDKSADRAREQATEVAAADNDEPICDDPKAKFNQCSFTCEGAAKGDKSCRTEREGVACVRRICKANGHLEEAHRMPASQSEACAADHAIVRECGSYW